MTDFVYRMRHTKGSSEKYGPCEVCRKHADSVYLLTEMRTFFSQTKNAPSITHHGGRTVFGHKDCLSRETHVRTVKIPYMG